MTRAIADFLRASGLSLSDPNLSGTPERVMHAFADEFLCGYGQSPAEVLSDRFPVSKASDRELVVVTDITFRSMCPHHLLPYEGVAHVAYVPGPEVVGFGRLAKLVSVFANRLILQEELARQVAVSLVEVLGSRGAACLTEAKQSCLRLRGPRQRDAITHAEAYEGLLKRPALREELWRRLGKRPVARTGRAR